MGVEKMALLPAVELAQLWLEDRLGPAADILARAVLDGDLTALEPIPDDLVPPEMLRRLDDVWQAARREGPDAKVGDMVPMPVAVGVALERRAVVMLMPQPCRFMCLTAENAERVAGLLRKTADLLRERVAKLSARRDLQ
jgi:hypothetical protein